MVWAHVIYPVLTLLHSERPKLHTILAFLSAIGLNNGTNKVKRQIIYFTNSLRLRVFSLYKSCVTQAQLLGKVLSSKTDPIDLVLKGKSDVFK